MMSLRSRILVYLQDHSPTTTRRIAEDLKVNPHTVRNYLYWALLEGYVQHFQGLRGAWEITEKGMSHK